MHTPLKERFPDLPLLCVPLYVVLRPQAPESSIRLGMHKLYIDNNSVSSDIENNSLHDMRVN